VYVDSDGRPVTGPGDGPPHRVTVVTRRGERLARLVHAPEVDGDRVDRALGAALRLALENEQLRAAALAELKELDESRTRIVERAADERQRLERNLHDGAQQRMVALSLLVRMLGSRATESVERPLADRAEVLTRAALDELRRVARGIYPAVLADAGLTGAVLELAQSSTDVALVVENLPRTRFAGLVETTAYLVVEAALADARAQRAAQLCVRTVTADDALTVALRYPTTQPTRFRRDLLDTVAALGGDLQVRSERSCTEVRLVLPCAS
jgi:signal transduction histidine kinase